MRIFGYAIVPSGEIIDGLRANVSKLQHAINRRDSYIASLDRSNGKLKRQLASDRCYIDDVKGAAWSLLRVSDGTLPEMRELRRAIEGRAARRDA